MNIRPLIFLRNLDSAEIGDLTALSRLRWPIYVDALEMQKSAKSHEIMACFLPDQLNLISKEVEDVRPLIHDVVHKAIDGEFSHIIQISNYNKGTLQKVTELRQILLENPFHFLYFTARKEEQKKNNPFMQRLLDLGEQDYRRLVSDTWVAPVFFLQNFTYKKDSPLLSQKLTLQALRKQLAFLECPVLPSDEEVTRLRGILNLEQQFYNWWLMALTSLHRAQSPWHSSLSFAVGAFLACTPFYGLQTGLIILFCVVFRLNFPVAFLGSQISLPPLYSLIVPLQLYVGFEFTNQKFDFNGSFAELAQTHFLAWLIGSLIVGTSLSVLMGCGWYWMQKKSQVQKVNWTGKMRGGRLGNALIVFLMKTFGLRFGYFLLYFVVPYFYVFAPRARRGVSQYYSLVEPKQGPLQRQGKVLQHLMCFAKVIMDQAFQAHQKDLSFKIEYVQGHALKENQKEGARLMVFSHFGGWGLATQGFSRRSQGQKIHLIRYSTQALSSEEVIKERNQTNLQTLSIQPGEPIFMVLHEILREGGHLAIMGDRPFDNNFELKKFLGRLAPFPSTPFRIAKAYQAEVSFVSGFRRGYKNYGLATETIELSEKTVQDVMNEYIQFLETYLKRYPDQWFNLYSFWSELPTLPDGTQCIPKKNVVLGEV